MKANHRVLTVPIFGLTCGGGGALAAERALARTRGIVRAYVNPLTEMAYVEFAPEETDEGVVVRAIESVGLRAGTPSFR